MTKSRHVGCRIVHTLTHVGQTRQVNVSELDAAALSLAESAIREARLSEVREAECLLAEQRAVEWEECINYREVGVCHGAGRSPVGDGIALSILQIQLTLQLWVVDQVERSGVALWREPQ